MLPGIDCAVTGQVEVMKMLDHPGIVRLYETYRDQTKLHLVMEQCQGGDLFDFLMKTSIEVISP